MPNAKKRARHIAEPLHLVELGSIERWLESLVNKEPRNHEIDFVPPFIPPF